MRCSFYCPTDAIKIGYLNSWRVNGAYRFDKISKNEQLQLPYITKDSKGFYRCFIRYFAEVEKVYQEYLLTLNK